MNDRTLFYYKKSLGALEFDKVLNVLCSFAAMERTRGLIRATVPLWDKGCVRRLLSETDAAYAMLSLNRRVPLAALPETVDLNIGRAVKGITLTPADFMQLARLMRVCIDMHNYRGDSGADTGALDLFFDRMFTDRALYDKIDRTFPDGEHVADDASPELASIRRSILRESNKIKDMLDKYIRDPAVAPYLQDALVTIRYDRFVIPVRAESRGQVKGLVHDTSNTGSTLFIEPMFVIEANNNIQRLESEEKREIERILAALTAEVAQYAPQLGEAYGCLISLDYIFARAKYSYENDMFSPRISDKRIVRVRAARHPLIPRDVMVPLDIEMGGDTDTVIVTGPNTGGKTVFLKTLGLMCLMAKAGMHLPCADAEIYVFDRVYADIGDEQSIEQSLSTFSSHLKNTKNIISSSNKNSLVLFDELGSGTDPVEGAALAIAIIRKVRENGSFAACTTHYSELKTFALEEPGIKNASFEFDLDTLSPTYRLQMGVPGRSYAFEISRHLGLHEDVIKNARALVGEDVRRFDRVVDGLQREKSGYEKLRRELSAERAALAEQKRRLDEKQNSIDKNAEHELENARNRARQVVEKARSDANRMLDELKKQKDEIDRESLRRMKSAVKSATAKLDAGDPGAAVREYDGTPIGDAASVGVKVYVASISRDGEIVSVDGNSVRVNCGGITISCKREELYCPQGEKAPEPKQPRRSVSVQRAERGDTGMELDIRGQTVMEALDAVDRFIDRAVLDRLSGVTIIHGKGTGALRSGVQEHLRHHKQVKSFHLGVFGQGDSGVTIVELK